jgi:hypothetical protein
VLLGHTGQQKRAVRLEPGVPPPANRFGSQASPRAPGLHQIDDEGHRHPEMPGRRMPRANAIEKANNSFTQIK